ASKRAPSELFTSSFVGFLRGMVAARLPALAANRPGPRRSLYASRITQKSEGLALGSYSATRVLEGTVMAAMSCSARFSAKVAPTPLSVPPRARNLGLRRKRLGARRNGPSWVPDPVPETE